MDLFSGFVDSPYFQRNYFVDYKTYWFFCQYAVKNKKLTPINRITTNVRRTQWLNVGGV